MGSARGRRLFRRLPPGEGEAVVEVLRRARRPQLPAGEARPLLLDGGGCGRRRPVEGQAVIDYSALESTIGQNWYELDPDLQARVGRDAPAEDFDWADKTLRDFGALVGGPVAANAELSDLHPPELVRYDKWANEVGEIVHHPATIENKRLLWEAGYASG